MGLARKLGDIHQSLTLLAEQREVIRSLINAESAQRINGLVEDIHEVLMDYQVCVLNYLFLPCLMFVRHLCNRIFLTRVVSLL